MNVLENEKVVILRQQLVDEISRDVSRFERLLLEQEDQASRWEFATDEYYTLIPFQHELNRQRQGRLLESRPPNERPSETNCFAFGFSGNATLLLVQRSNGESLGVNSRVYRSLENGSIEYLTICKYSSSALPTKLVSLGMLTPVTDGMQIDICMSSNLRNWTVTVYRYKDQLVSKVLRYSEGWNGPTENDFVYNNGLLERIRVGSIDWWES